METYRYAESGKLFERAKKAIPGGVYGRFALAANAPGYPRYFSGAGGSRF